LEFNFEFWSSDLTSMKTITSIVIATAATLAATNSAFGHPGSGIVVDSQGNVYFTHTGHGVGKIDPQGKRSYIHESKGGHWLCLDPEGSFSQTQPKYFERITPAGAKPALIFADGGSPVAVLNDGNLYYASNNESKTPGGLQVTRMSIDGVTSVFTPELARVTEKLGITGLAPGPEGILYVACPNAVLKLKMDGTFTVLASEIHLKDCDVDYPDHNPNMLLPSLRGLAVDENRTVFAAGVGCRAVVRISPDGKVATISKAERPWSPTGVAVHRGEVYVLEYTNANGSPNEGWWPRIRKLGHEWKPTTIWTDPAFRNE
jgi:hypothetical protein